MPIFYLELKGDAGEFHRLRPVSLSDSQVVHAAADWSELPPVAARRCYLWPDTSHQLSRPLAPGDSVEVLQKSGPKEGPDLADGTSGSVWQPARVLGVKGEFVICALDGDAQQLIVDRSEVRPAGDHRPLASLRLHQCALALPRLDPPAPEAANRRPTVAEVLDALHGCRLSDEPCLVLWPGGEDAVALATPSESDAAKLALLSGLIARRLRWKAAVQCDLDEKARLLSELESARAASEAAAAARRPRLLLEFPVPAHLVGKALGSGGKTVAAARSLPGLTFIRYDNEAGVFRVFGTSPESALEARRMLELTEELMRIPTRLVGRVLGKGSLVAQSVVDKAGLHNLILGEERQPVTAAALQNGADSAGQNGDHLTDEDGSEAGKASESAEQQAGCPSTSIRLIGTREAVDSAKYMLDYQLAIARELDQLEREKLQVQASLLTPDSSGKAPSPKRKVEEKPVEQPAASQAAAADALAERGSDSGSAPVSKTSSVNGGGGGRGAGGSPRGGRGRDGRAGGWAYANYTDYANYDHYNGDREGDYNFVFDYRYHYQQYCHFSNSYGSHNNNNNSYYNPNYYSGNHPAGQRFRDKRPFKSAAGAGGQANVRHRKADHNPSDSSNGGDSRRSQFDNQQQQQSQGLE
ncbi:hypothetical protein BOX15_Mlig012685g1 [Macrostomum lignano]|uniref:Agenet-like domain-containing protein n=2 Tax=Macrostomum lignano TaxID=282301 RepID=A0A267FK40_9PLAT|nr:hypothetical protein BOX15_Mlig012685g1 [Macrostomum lignano]